MRKRILTGLLTVAALSLALTSCQRDEHFNEGTMKDVSISVLVPESQYVKSNENPGSGDMVNRCILEIYQEGVLYGERMYADISAMTANFTARLMTGETYTFVFWADNAEGSATEGFTDLYYNTSAGLSSVTLNTGTYVNNTDGLDAFYGTFSQSVDNTGDLSFKLTRPFGQLNLFTLDAQESGIILENIEARVSFSEVPAGFNAIDGTLSNERVQITPGTFSVPVNTVVDGTDPEETQLTFDYLFAAPEEDETLVNFTLELQENGQDICPPYEASNIPVRRNYKTNVKANFLTSGVDIVIEIDPIFGDDGGEPVTEPVAVTAISGTVDYYGTTNGTTNANYILSLNDGTGRSFVVDIYGAEGTELPAGTYTFSTNRDEANTFFAENSNIAEWGMATDIFTSGTLTVGLEGDQYEISFEAATAEENYLVTYNGSLSFNDLTIPPTGFETDKIINNASVLVNFYGVNAVKGDLYQINVEIDDFNNSGYNVYLELMANMNAEGEIAGGTYNVASTSEVNTVVIGSNSYARYTDDMWIGHDAPISSGSITFTDSNITGEVYVQGGHKVTFTTEGLPSYDNVNIPLPGSTVDGPVDATYNGPVNGYAQAYSDYWHITISPDYQNEGPALNLDIANSTSYNDGFAGTYTCSNEGGPYTFLTGSTHFSGSYAENAGVVYYHSVHASHSGIYATISDGTLVIEEIDRDEVTDEWNYTTVTLTCNVELTGTDPLGNSIHVRYENIPIQLSDNSSSTWFNF